MDAVMLFPMVLLSMAIVMTKCTPRPLGLESRTIPDTSMTASSEWSAWFGPQRGRLNIRQQGEFRGSWVARVRDDKQWIQVDLLHTYRITSVATQGRQDYDQWVTRYKVACSNDGNNFETVRVSYTGYCSSDKIFTGNSNRNTIVTNYLPEPQYCRFIRVMPVSFHGRVSLRMEIYGEGPVTSTCE